MDELSNDEDKEEIEKKSKKESNIIRAPDHDMGLMHFNRWQDMLNYTTQIGIRLNSGEYNLYDNYRNAFYDTYIQMKRLFVLRGLRKPVQSNNKKDKGLVQKIDEDFSKADEFKIKCDRLPSGEDEYLDFLKHKFLLKAISCLREANEYFFDAIQVCGLGVPTHQIISREQQKRQTDSGGLL